MTSRATGRLLTAASAMVLAAYLVVAGPLGPSRHRRPADPAGQARPGAVHTDAIAAFVDDGALVANTMADVDGELGKRLDADSLIFNLTDGRTPIPAGDQYAFLGAAGQTVSMAPQTQDYSLIWPGFSTQNSELIQAIGTGVTVGIDLTGFRGPSDAAHLEVFTVGAFGRPQGIFSSPDETLRSWSRQANQHTHANWAFSEQGRYVLTFTLTATIDGTEQSVAQDYIVYVIFYVGDMADYPTVDTTTTLTAPAAPVPSGEVVAPTADVSPASAQGYVEFLAGTTSLGWTQVSAGRASLDGIALPDGAHDVTAWFTPRWTQEFAASASDAIPVTVGDASPSPTPSPSDSPTPSATPSTSGSPSPSVSPSRTPSAGPSPSLGRAVDGAERHRRGPRSGGHGRGPDQHAGCRRGLRPGPVRCGVAASSPVVVRRSPLTASAAAGAPSGRPAPLGPTRAVDFAAAVDNPGRSTARAGDDVPPSWISHRFRRPATRQNRQVVQDLGTS